MLRSLLFVVIFILVAGWATPAAAQTAAPPSPTPTPTQQPVARLDSPSAGQALQGKVAIHGRAAGPGFSSYELSFGYANNPAGTWFLIASSNSPVEQGALAEWDTSTISDGDYTLRLLVTSQEAELTTILLTGLRVRNYTLIETSTPTPRTPTLTPIPGEPSATPTVTASQLAPSATPLPTNAAILTSQDLATSVRDGSLGILALFALGGIYLLARRIRYQR